MEPLIRIIRAYTIRAKILWGFAIVTTLVIIFSAFTFWNMRHIERNIDDMIEQHLQLLLAHEHLAKSINIRLAEVRGYMMTGDKKYKEAFDEARADALEQIKVINGLTEPSMERQALIDKALSWNEKIEQDVFDVYNQGNTALAIKNLHALNAMGEEIQLGYQKMAEKSEKEMQVLGEMLVQNTHHVRNIGIIFAVAVMILSVVIGIYVARIISRPIQRIIARVGEMANGDISHEPMEANKDDEVGGLVYSINQLNSKLYQIINSIHSVSEQVAANSEELAQSSEEVKAGAAQVALTMQDLAQGAEAEANSACELAVVMDTFKKM